MNAPLQCSQQCSKEMKRKSRKNKAEQSLFCNSIPPTPEKVKKTNDLAHKCITKMFFFFLQTLSIYKSKINLWFHTPVPRTQINPLKSPSKIVFHCVKAWCYICPNAAVSFCTSLEKMQEFWDCCCCCCCWFLESGNIIAPKVLSGIKCVAGLIWLHNDSGAASINIGLWRYSDHFASSVNSQEESTLFLLLVVVNSLLPSLVLLLPLLLLEALASQ